jgi:hypothetical protein
LEFLCKINKKARLGICKYTKNNILTGLGLILNLNPIVKEEKQKDEEMEEKLSTTLKN